MKDFYLTKFKLNGIKCLSNDIELSFYKKTFDKELDTKKYNIKGIYGMNGSGKSAIITAVDIFKDLVLNTNFLNNPINQDKLRESINKKNKKLSLSSEYLVKIEDCVYLFRYEVCLKNKNGDYLISSENLDYKKAESRVAMKNIFSISNGKITYLVGLKDKKRNDEILEKTKNLLAKSTFISLYTNILRSGDVDYYSFEELCPLTTYGLANNILVYMDDNDKHEKYLLNDYTSNDDLQNLKNIAGFIKPNSKYMLLNDFIVSKKEFNSFQKDVIELSDFLKIFKKDLRNISIDKKEDKYTYICQLIMHYDGYKISSEFESTGIKKLIKLFAYFKEMMNGKIVFIDELDSNLHDVYLCGLLDYLMHYGKGQICFTTHNIGPMDILQKNKNSIDFLSDKQTITSWRKNGHYQPSVLYKAGLIEGSIFNIDSIDFLGVLEATGEDE